MSLVFIIMYFWFVLIGGRTARFGYTRFLFRVKFRAFPPPRQFVDEVAQDVHVVDECLVARRIRVFAGLLAVVREPFGGHPIKVVGRLQEIPDVVEIGVAELPDVSGLGIEFAEGFLLEFVAKPGR